MREQRLSSFPDRFRCKLPKQVMWNNICGPEEDRPKDMEREADMEEKAAITDEWKLSLLNTLVIDCFFTAKQAQQIVRSFSYKETMVGPVVLRPVLFWNGPAAAEPVVQSTPSRLP